VLPRLCRAVARGGAQAGRGHGQSRQPQVGRAAPHDQRRKRQALEPAALFADLNPIEQTFAKIKHRMRMTQKHAVNDTWRQIGDLVATIRSSEWINCC
jgi:hypothetical protein